MTEEKQKKIVEFVLARKAVMDEDFNARKVKYYDPSWQHYKSRPAPRRNPNDNNIFIPITRELIEAVLPRLTGDFLSVTKPFIDPIPWKKPAENEKNVVEGIRNWLFFRAQTQELGLKYRAIAKQALIYGDTVAMVAPRFSRTDRQNRGWSVLNFVDLYNYRIDPSATCFEERFDELLLSQVRIADLQLLAQREPARGWMNLKKIKGRKTETPPHVARHKAEGLVDTAGEEVVGNPDVDLITWWGPFDSASGQFTRFAEKIHRIIIANGTLVLMEEDPFGNNDSPFLFHRFEDSPGEIHGEGIPWAIFPIQRLINKLENSRLDYLDRMLEPTPIINEHAIANPEDAGRWGPNKKIIVRAGWTIRDAIDFVIPGGGSSLQAAMFEQQKISQQAEKRTGVTEDFRGVPGEFPVQRTATESEQKFMSAASRYQNHYQHMTEVVLKRWSGLTVQHDAAKLEKEKSKAKIPYRIFGADRKPDFKELRKEDLKLEMDFFPNVDPNQIATTARIQQMTNAVQILPAVDQFVREDGLRVNWPQVGKVYTENALPPAPELWIVPFEQPPPMAPEGEEGMLPGAEAEAGAEGGMPPMPEELLSIPEPAAR